MEIVPQLYKLKKIIKKIFSLPSVKFATKLICVNMTDVMSRININTRGGKPYPARYLFSFNELATALILFSKRLE